VEVSCYAAANQGEDLGTVISKVVS
jgi:hypothetical protein